MSSNAKNAAKTIRLRTAEILPGTAPDRLLLRLLIIALLFAGCQALPEKAPKEKDGSLYGTTKGLFNYRWWNYYERALSFADGGFWKDAEQDLREAIGQREADQRRARTYGMHFIDYFPHRELGIVLYQQGLLKEALSELNTSMASNRSAKAALYIDRVRKEIIEKEGLDASPPEVEIKSPIQPFLTKDVSIVIAGIARDDTFVRHIHVGQEEVPIDVSDTVIPFKATVSLEPESNTVPIVITDLAGKKTKAVIKIQVDRLGPTIRIDDTIQMHSISENRFHIKGVAFDDQGMAELRINGTVLPCRGSQAFDINETISTASGEQKIHIEALDLAGNKTIAALDAAEEVKWKIARDGMRAGGDLKAPIISIRGMEDGWTTSLDQVYIEGNVRDNDIITQISINDKNILNRPVHNFYFSKLATLKAGPNAFAFKAMDASGNVDIKTLTIKHTPLKVRQVGSRLRVAVNAFKRNCIGPDRHQSYGFEDLLAGAMINHSRFSTVERQALTSVLEELKLSQTKLVDESTALKLGKILAADCVLLGSILERKDSVEVYSRIVDTETTEILTAVDVYGEHVDMGVLRTLGEGMELKLARELPVVEGAIIQGGEEFIVDFGKDAGVKNGMKLIIFDLAGTVAHPGGTDFVEIGQARIQSVMQERSYGQMAEGTGHVMIQSRMRAITR